MELVHLSKYKREKGHLGGVEKFAAHLKRTFPSLQLYASDDVPEAQGSDLAIARTLNAKLLEEGRIGKNTIVIADGFWQVGLKGKVKAIISVSHGTYLGVALANELHRFGQTSNFLKIAKWQEGAYRAADVVVAVSPMAQWELKAFYGLDSVLIWNGVDLDVYKPKKKREGKILHVASAGRKQLEMVEAVAGVLRRPIEYLNVKSGQESEEAERWATGSVAFFPSLYEGAAYSTLEAMACGLVPVSYRTGTFWDIPKDAAVAITDHYPNVYAEAILRALKDGGKFKPRRWVEQNASFTAFANNWRKLISRFN